MDSSGFRSFLGLVNFVFGSERVKRQRKMARLLSLQYVAFIFLNFLGGWGWGPLFEWHLIIISPCATGLYRKIVSCVLLRSGLGSPTDIGVVREATGNIWKHSPLYIHANNCKKW